MNFAERENRERTTENWKRAQREDGGAMGVSHGRGGPIWDNLDELSLSNRCLCRVSHVGYGKLGWIGRNGSVYGCRESNEARARTFPDRGTAKPRGGVLK